MSAKLDQIRLGQSCIKQLCVWSLAMMMPNEEEAIFVNLGRFWIENYKVIQEKNILRK